MRNNKGQVLVLFVMLMPIIFLFMALLIDVGLMYTEKRSVDNTLKYAIGEALENDKTEEEVSLIINENCDNISLLTVEKLDDKIKVQFQSTKKSIFSIVLKRSHYNINSNFIGSIKDEKIVIERGK